MHLGVILPNYGAPAAAVVRDPVSVENVRRIAEAAEELGFDSVWATEHILVGPEGVDRYGDVLEPFSTLAWIAGFTERIALGTSITILPLHNPILVAKQVATTQLLSERPFYLGVGAGWHEDEYRFLGMGFADRGRRLDEEIQVARALWAGERSFDGAYWSFADATFGPLPSRAPEIWVGGVKGTAVRRALALGDAWHPSSNVDVAFVRRVKEEHPALRLVPRTTPELFETMLELGADGGAVMFPDVPAMRAFAARYR